MRLIDADALLAKFNKNTDIAYGRRNGKWSADFVLYCKVADAVEEMPTVGGWISVNERLPEKPGRYLVCTSTITKVAWFLLSLKANPQFEYEMQGEPDRPGFFNGDSEGDWVQDDVTHWMVLPERPKEEE